MRVRDYRLPLFFPLLCVLIFLASCGYSGVGTIPSGTPSRGNGTPAVIPSPTTVPQAVPTAPPGSTGNVYAFVRQNQLWVALNGARPRQATHFSYTSLPDVFWHQPLWSPGDRFLAFIMAALPTIQGGGGCPAPDYGANGGLYVLDTATGQLKALTVAPQPATAASTTPRNDYWQDVFWEDSTHLLAWYNGPVGEASSSAGLYRYDLVSGSLAPVIPLSRLGVATLFSSQSGLPLLLSLRYSNEQLYYQVIVHPFEQQSQFIIYRRSILHPETASSIVMKTGSEPWCVAQQGEPFEMPGWDVSRDGGQLVAQVIVSTGTSQGLSAIEVLNLSDGVTTDLFTQAPSSILGHDVALAWGPDNQTVVMTVSHPPAQEGPYTATLANPSLMQQYVPALAGQVTWRPDSSAFALAPQGANNSTASPAVYLFTPGDIHGKLLLAGAQAFVWG